MTFSYPNLPSQLLMPGIPPRLPDAPPAFPPDRTFPPPIPDEPRPHIFPPVYFI
jgi:hypothetical protein